MTDRASSVASARLLGPLYTVANTARDPAIMKVTDDNLKSDPYEGGARGSEGKEGRKEEGGRPKRGGKEGRRAHVQV